MGDADKLLEYLVSVFSAQSDGADEPCEVTVQVNGMLISGRLVSVLDFYRAYRDRGMPPRRDLWEQLIDREVKDNEEIAMLRVAVQETIGNDTAHLSSRESDLLQRLHVEHLHLENAVLQTPGSAPVTLPVWRVRLVDVSGWMVGYLRDFEPLASPPAAEYKHESHTQESRAQDAHAEHSRTEPSRPKVTAVSVSSGSMSPDGVDEHTNGTLSVEDTSKT